MFATGVLYLIFEKSLEAQRQSAKVINTFGRMIMGCQIGLILLAIIVTRSSVASLQAKEGLPIGNQIVGWLVMSKLLRPPACVSRL